MGCSLSPEALTHRKMQMREKQDKERQGARDTEMRQEGRKIKAETEGEKERKAGRRDRLTERKKDRYGAGRKRR